MPFIVSALELHCPSDACIIVRTLGTFFLIIDFNQNTINGKKESFIEDIFNFSGEMR